MTYPLPAGNFQFPSQRKGIDQKTDEWAKKCIESAEQHAIFADQNLRETYHNKKTNYDLYANILNQKDVEKVCNPFGLQGLAVPAKMQNYPISSPKINLLIGEEFKRKFDWKVRVANDDAISSKEMERSNKIKKFIKTLIEQTPEDEMETTLKHYMKYLNYEWQDFREEAGTKLLNHLFQKQNLKRKFNKAFKDVTLVGEEIGFWDIVATEPVFEVLNPLKVHTVRSGESPYFEDADIIVIDTYMSPGKIIDDYWDVLTPSQVKQVEGGLTSTTGGGGGQKGFNDLGNYPDLAIRVDETIDTAQFEQGIRFGAPIDSYGNIRVLRTYWRSMRKMKWVTTIDEYGKEKKELRDEKDEVLIELGETYETIWISEWWEGHKIGGTINAKDNAGIYTRLQPKKLQYRSMQNPSRCHPGIVGTIHNTNDSTVVSPMDMMKPYQYMYNVLMYNTELMISKNWGKIMRLPMHEKPEGWHTEQWLSFARSMNALPYDGFKESNKGASMGKLAGNLNAQSPVIDMEMGNSIQLYMNMMQHVKDEMGEIVGVTKARQGQISSSQAVGNVQREMIQTSHITEWLFSGHDEWKLRCLTVGLETAKIAVKDNPQKYQDVLGDMSTLIYQFGDNDSLEADFGIFLSDSGRDTELYEMMKQLAHAGIQNDKMNFSTLMSIYMDNSLSSIRRKIESSEKDTEQAAIKARQEELQVAQQGQEAQAQAAQAALEWEKEKTYLEEETKMNIAAIQQEGNGGEENKALLDFEKHAETVRKNRENLDLKHNQLQETERKNKANEGLKKEQLAIQRNKPLRT
tara:strand:- start:5259 stop:7658 length:2400 start_codon:yes stop_codon:yes gene_type:complete